MEGYIDEKHPQVAYQVIELETEPKPKRPFWRKFVRVVLTVLAISMLWSTFAPILHHGCRRYRGTPQPPADLPPSLVDAIRVGGDEAPVEHYTFGPDLKNFWIKQESFHVFTRTEVTGDVVVVSCPKAEKISAHFQFDVSDDSIREKLEITPADDGITFKLDPFSLVKQTVKAKIWIVIPKGDDHKLDHLLVSAVQPNVWVKESFTTNVNATHVSSVSGKITVLGKAADKNSDYLKITTTSGKIEGEFPLRKGLDLESVSGSITADVDSADLKEEPGYLKTSSVSGAIAVRFISDLHPRPLISTHKSVSGAVKIDYPEDWQGDLKLKTSSGGINVEGQGTKVVKKEKDIVGKFWKVIKGDGKSKGFVGTASGKIDVLIGDPEW